MMQNDLNKHISWIKGYVRRNWGSPFIFAFMVLLLSCAIILSAGLNNAAIEIAVFAFYALVAGFLLQLVSCFKYAQVSRDEAD